MPSLQALQQMRNRLHTAFLGKRLMKWTALACGKEMRTLAGKINQRQIQVLEDDFQEAFISLARCRYYAYDINHMVIEGIEDEACVTVTSASKFIAGAKLQTMEINDRMTMDNKPVVPYLHYGLGKGGKQIRETQIKFRELLGNLVYLTEQRSAFQVVHRSYMDATKKKNVMQKVVIPKTIHTIQYIQRELEELGREDFYRMKMIKNLKVKKKAASEVKKPVEVEEALPKVVVVEEILVEEPLVEEPLVEEPLVEEPLLEEPLVEEPLVEEPLVEPVLEDKSLAEEADGGAEPVICDETCIECIECPKEMSAKSSKVSRKSEAPKDISAKTSKVSKKSETTKEMTPKPSRTCGKSETARKSSSSSSAEYELPCSVECAQYLDGSSETSSKLNEDETDVCDHDEPSPGVQKLASTLAKIISLSMERELQPIERATVIHEQIDRFIKTLTSRPRRERDLEEEMEEIEKICCFTTPLPSSVRICGPCPSETPVCSCASSAPITSPKPSVSSGKSKLPPCKRSDTNKPLPCGKQTTPAIKVSTPAASTHSRALKGPKGSATSRDGKPCGKPSTHESKLLTTTASTHTTFSQGAKVSGTLRDGKDSGFCRERKGSGTSRGGQGSGTSRKGERGGTYQKGRGSDTTPKRRESGTSSWGRNRSISREKKASRTSSAGGKKTSPSQDGRESSSSNELRIFAPSSSSEPSIARKKKQFGNGSCPSSSSGLSSKPCTSEPNLPHDTPSLFSDRDYQSDADIEAVYREFQKLKAYIRKMNEIKNIPSRTCQCDCGKSSSTSGAVCSDVEPPTTSSEATKESSSDSIINIPFFLKMFEDCSDKEENK